MKSGIACQVCQLSDIIRVCTHIQKNKNRNLVVADMNDFSVAMGFWKKRFYSAVKYVIKHARLKRMQAVGYDSHMKKLLFYRRMLSGGPLDHYEFSCSSTPVKREVGSKWNAIRVLLPCLHPESSRSLSVSVSIPRFSMESPKCEERWSGEEIDELAEDFIAKFHKQMELQRQDSYIECQEMLARGA